MKRSGKIIASLFLAVLVVFAAAFAYFPPPGTIPVLMYHFVGEKKDAEAMKNFVSTESFRRQMAFLKFFGYRVISLDDLYAIKTSQKKPLGRELAITFDDGNYTFRENALPVLEKHRFPVTVFCVSESARQGLFGSMSAETLRELSQKDFVMVGSHSMTHPLLARMGEDEIARELTGSKEALEVITGRTVYYFAYPSSDLDERVVRQAKQAGYRMAFATSEKKIRGLEKGFYTMPRVKITRTADIPFVYWAEVSGIYSFFKEWREQAKNKKSS